MSEVPNDGSNGETSEPLDRLGDSTPNSLEDLVRLSESGAPLFGQFEILGVVSIGKNSKVFKARDTRLQRLVSLKICEDLSAAQDIEAILSEGRILARMDHPNVARCYSVEDISGTLVLVNEWIEGQTLESFMANHQLSYQQVVTLFRKIVGGVGAIHAKGLLHRDLKPSNIIVDANQQPKIIDLGLAHERVDLNPNLSGTLSYVAPEVANFKPELIGLPTDIFGLGGVLYFMLSGQPLYSGESKDILLEKARNCQMEPSNTVSDSPANKLDRICMRCLLPDPNYRYQSTDQLLRAIQSLNWGRVALGIGLLIVASTVIVALMTVDLTSKPWGSKHSDDVAMTIHAQLSTLSDSDSDLTDVRLPITGKITTDRQTLPRSIISFDFDGFTDGGGIENRSGDQLHGLRYYDVTLHQAGVSNGCISLNASGIENEPGCVAVDQGVPETSMKRRTISLWFNAEQVANGKQVLYEEGSADRGLNIYLDSGWVYIGRWNFERQTYLRAKVNPNQWHHVCLVFNSQAGTRDDSGPKGKLAGYLDGQLFGSGHAKSIRQYRGHLCIGRQDTNRTRFHDIEKPHHKTPYAFKGLVDELRIFDQPLNPTQIKLLFEKHAPIGE